MEPSVYIGRGILFRENDIQNTVAPMTRAVGNPSFAVSALVLGAYMTFCGWVRRCQSRSQKPIRRLVEIESSFEHAKRVCVGCCWMGT